MWNRSRGANHAVRATWELACRAHCKTMNVVCVRYVDSWKQHSGLWKTDKSNVIDKFRVSVPHNLLCLKGMCMCMGADSFTNVCAYLCT
jgi:hypothetical protein